MLVLVSLFAHAHHTHIHTLALGHVRTHARMHCTAKEGAGAVEGLAHARRARAHTHTHTHTHTVQRRMEQWRRSRWFDLRHLTSTLVSTFISMKVCVLCCYFLFVCFWEYKLLFFVYFWDLLTFIRSACSCVGDRHRQTQTTDRDRDRNRDRDMSGASLASQAKVVVQTLEHAQCHTKTKC
jgi:hypothetical protein